MKVCSICRRQYADSLKFCLDDGTVLTHAPELDATLVDPQATLRLNARETDPRPVALNHTKPFPWIAVAAVSIVAVIAVVGVAALLLINSATPSSNESNSNTSSAPVQSSPQTPTLSPTEEVLRAEAAVDAALLQNDTEALSRLLADEYRFVSDLGLTANKFELLSLMRSGNLVYKSRTTTDTKVEVASDKAELTGHARARGSLQRQPFTDSSFYRNTYVRRDGRWLLVSGTAWHRQ